MAVPARKVSKTRRDKRRTHDKIDSPTQAVCTNCKAVIKPHRVCDQCGFYKGKQVIEIKDKSKKE